MAQLRRDPTPAGVAVAIVLLTACTSVGSPAPTASVGATDGSPGPSAPSSVPSSPVSAPGADAVVVTFRVADAEEYRILLTDPADIAIAQRLLAGEEETQRIPSGVIVRGGDGGVNTGYSWHIDPESVEFAEVTIELCDGRPSFVENGTLSGERFCPWSAEVVEIVAAD